MKTLGKEITKRFFKDDGGFDKLQAYWGRQWQNEQWREQLEPIHYFLYSALRGKDWKKGFTPITNAVKLTNGQRPMQVVERIYQQLDRIILNDEKEWVEQYFGGCITVDSLRQLRKLLPDRRYVLGASAYVQAIPVDQAA
jgi:hypothetical protein